MWKITLQILAWEKPVIILGAISKYYLLVNKIGRNCGLLEVLVKESTEAYALSYTGIYMLAPKE